MDTEHARKDLQGMMDKFAKASRLLDIVEKLVLNNCDQASVLVSYDGDVMIYNLPYSNDVIAKNDLIMIENGFSFVTDVSPQWTGTYTREFSMEGFGNTRVDLRYSADIAGSTCTREVVSYEKRPVYEIRCKRGNE